MKINQIKNVVLPLLLLFCLIGCSEDKEPQTYPPTLVTNSAAELTRFEALLSGSVVPHANSVVKAEVFLLFAKYFSRCGRIYSHPGQYDGRQIRLYH